MATPSDRSATQAGYCLRGKIGGVVQSYALRHGENRLGALDTNEIVLPAAGVSRIHARLVVADGHLQVEDMESKNGTFIAGRRIESSTVGPGDEVRFGPVALRFQELHHDDDELAITFEPASDQTATYPIDEASLVSGSANMSLSRQWLQLAEAFHDRLHSKEQGDIGRGLRLLVTELRLASACVVEMTDGWDAIVLAVAGEVEELHIRDLKRRLTGYMAEGARHDIYFETVAETSDMPLSFAALFQPGRDPLVLALWGSYPGRSDSQLLVRLLTRMLVPCRPETSRHDEAEDTHDFPGLIVPQDYVYAQSEAMRKIYRLMQTLSQGDLPILIVGETGVGKEYLAQILHRSSPRRHRPFVAINCAAIPSELLEAELFGIGDGVATGVTARKGRFQMADGGTLFLDEIGDMSADLQAKLLRALQEQEVHPVGRSPVKVDVRVLAATNQMLSQRIEDGSFRADLYYRLAGYVLEIPPLRERTEDIPALVEHFLRECATELGRPIRGLTVRALRMLAQYPWPGNVRELANEVRRAVYLCPENETVESPILSPAIREHARTTMPEPLRSKLAAETVEIPRPDLPTDESQELPAPLGLGLGSLNLEHLEAQAITEALRRCRQNQVQAAKLLGISRQKLRRRMARLGQLPSQ